MTKITKNKLFSANIKNIRLSIVDTDFVYKTAPLFLFQAA